MTPSTHLREGGRDRAVRLRPLGRRQIEVLCSVASPHILLLTPCKVARALVRDGMLVERKQGPSQLGKPLCGAVGISALGLRALADAMETGRVDDALAHWAKEVEERRARRSASRHPAGDLATGSPADLTTTHGAE